MSRANEQKIVTQFRGVFALSAISSRVVAQEKKVAQNLPSVEKEEHRTPSGNQNAPRRGH